MALIKCPECGADVSDRAEKCMMCGFALKTGGGAVVPVQRQVSRSAEDAEDTIDDVTVSGYNRIINKRSGSAGVGLVLLVVLVITNPGVEKHQNAMAAYMIRTGQSDATAVADDLMGKGFSSLIHTGMSRMLVTSQSYLFFSLTKWASNGRTIGIGILGKVYLFYDMNSGSDVGTKKRTKHDDGSAFGEARSQSNIPVTDIEVYPPKKHIADLVPKGYKIIQEVNGDLNKDNLDDYVYVIEGVQNESRRGIVIAFNRGERYETALENSNIFSYDKDEVQYTPYVDVAVKKGVLWIRIEERFGGGANFHIRTHKFRFQNSDFELIGYDSDAKAGLDIGEISVNILTNKMKRKGYRLSDSDGDNSNEHEQWSDVVIGRTIPLRGITNLYAFDFMDYVTER